VKYLDFAKGPMQWLMTREEQRAWASVRTEDEARDFVDLFWARRDPTPGTPLNEFRTEAEGRARYADDRFKEGDRRGSLTERGRVLMVLGFPKNLASEAEKRTAQFVGATSITGQSDPTGGRAMAAREVWTYEHDHAVKFGMPKIEVVFLHDGTRGQVRRDPQRADFTSALPGAIKSYIVSPQLTRVPEWASSLPSPDGRGRREAPGEGLPSSQPPSSGPAPRDHLLPPGEGTASLKPTPKPAGANRLTLVEDAFAIDAQSGSDPFASLVNVTNFSRDGELGWAAEYCTGTASSALETVTVTLKVSGEGITFTAPPEDLAPDSIRRSPGCYVVRGAIPLSEIDPGKYTLSVSIQSYNLTRDFQVE
jgi:GWxTD domain-containing protein